MSLNVCLCFCYKSASQDGSLVKHQWSNTQERPRGSHRTSSVRRLDFFESSTHKCVRVKRSLRIVLLFHVCAVVCFVSFHKQGERIASRTAQPFAKLPSIFHFRITVFSEDRRERRVSSLAVLSPRLKKKTGLSRSAPFLFSCQ